MDRCRRCGRTITDFHFSLNPICKLCENIEKEAEEKCSRENERDARVEALSMEIIQSQIDVSSSVSNALDVAIDALNNPGDYCCPSCHFKTLLRDALRCPRCHGDVNHSYWFNISENERIYAEWKAEQKRVAAIQWEKDRPAREIAEDLKTRINKWSKLWGKYYFYLLPLLSVATMAVIVSSTGHAARTGKFSDLACGIAAIIVPIINWLVLLMLLIGSNDERAPLFWCMAFWTFLGMATKAITKPK
jgi:hypothetical protein